MLSPIDKIAFSVSPSLFNFKILSMIIPGMKARKTKPKICLNMTISKKIDAFAASRKAKIRRTNLPFKDLSISILVRTNY